MKNHPWQALGRFRYLWLGGCLAAILALVAGGGFLAWRFLRHPQPGGGDATIVQRASSDQTGAAAAVESERTSLSVRLSPGQAQPAQPQPVPVVAGEPLTQDELHQILARLPGFEDQPGDQADFRLAQEPIPPPLTGETVDQPFPPPEQPQIPETAPVGPLEVLRYAPEGEIPLAPFVNVTFNQPMVPLATLEDLAAEEVPVRLEPALPGTWRWLGTKTLKFEFDSELIDRLPKATEYTVTIPAGTSSLSGGVLAQEVSWHFRTPPVKVVSTYPQDAPQPLEPLFFIAFDQRIDPAAVLETIAVSAGSQKVSLVLVNENQLKANAEVSRLVKAAQEGRWLAFRATEPFPPDTPVSVTIGPGTPSAEGPLLSEASQSYGFHTYAPLAIVDHGCSWGGKDCPPLTPLYIRFNNPIDTAAYRDGLITISPQLPAAAVNIFGDTLQIQAVTKGRTTYTVVISKDLQDVFGQTLSRDERLTFRTGSTEPNLVGPQSNFVTVDPAAREPSVSFFTINYNRLDVKMYAVQPSDWPDFKVYLREWQRTDRPPNMPGRLVYDQTINIENVADALVETAIDLSPALGGKSGQVVLVVAPPRGLLQEAREVYYRTRIVWVQVTQIGLDAFVDQSEMVVWATALADGAPLTGVKIEPGPGSAWEGAVTQEDGTARFPIPSGSAYLVASKDGDQAMLPASTYYWGDETWHNRPVVDELRWYVFDDRQMYRPGEEVHLKGWLRRIGGGPRGDVGLVGASLSMVSYQLVDPQGNQLLDGRADVNALGGFDFSFTIPAETTNLGLAQLSLTANSGLSNNQYYHALQIQEFRRPEFEVSARNETSGPYFAGQHAVVAVAASYYAGGPLPNAEVTWQVSTSPSSYSPPNWPDFTFGYWQPWWWFYRGFNEFGPAGPDGQTTYETFSGLTDAAGEHYLRLDFDQLPSPRPYSLLAEATVMDVNRQAWASATSLLVHPADLYVGLRSDRYFVAQGEPLKIDLIVTDLDGNPVADRPVTLTAARLEWKYRAGDWLEEEADVQTCQVGSSAAPVTCTFETPLGGSYRITATVTDSQGRLNQSRFERWVSGGKRPPARQIEQEQVTLIPDKESYQPGEVAKILVQAPFSPAEGLLSVTRSGYVYTQRFQVSDGSATLEIPILEQHIPNLELQVDLVGAAPRLDDQGQALAGAPARPAYALGSLTLSIPALQRTLALQVSPQAQELEPGGETVIAVTVLDAQGAPLEGSELAVVVVDEAILALSNYQLADPVAAFYSQRASELLSTYGRQSVLLINPLQLLESGQVVLEKAVEGQREAAVAGAMPTMAPAMPALDASQESAAQPQPIRVRSDFNPLAVFAPQVRTDAEGKALIPVKLPDNLTRYRVMVVAVDAEGRGFGQGEANLTARLPLMVRPSAPRFLNFGDQFELPVLLQNQTDQDLLVEVVAQTANLELTGSAGLRVSVPARDRVEVRFPTRTVLAGTARLQIGAVSGTYADAATLALPVYTPATTEAFATYGVVDQGTVIQPVGAPTNVFPQYGGLEITTSSTALQALTDAVLYLVSYPFECSEQLASRVLAVAALRDVLTAFEAEGLPSPAEMEAAVKRDIQRLQGLQNFDGGFPYWRRGFDSIPFNTIHAAHALQRAEAKGFEVPAEMKPQLLEYLRNIESHYPSWYGQRTRQTLSAYALYVRGLLGERDPAKARNLLAEAGLEGLNLEAVGWLWAVLQDDPASAAQLAEIRRFVNSRVVETPGAANFTTYYDDQTYLLLSSDRRTDAILLDALIGDDPASDLIPKLVNGLLAHRTRGRWYNTQDNVFVLLALDRYFNTFEAQTPDFVAQIWLGDTYAGGHEYRGRTTERNLTEIPMAYLVDPTLGGGGTQNLILSKDGAGRLYYRLGLRYAPTDLQQDPLDMGFVVQRLYEAVDDPADVSRDEDGVWHIRAGARVRVRLTMVADNRRYHVALVDPLPAGLEIVNPALAVSGSTPQDPSSSGYRYGWWWWGTWYEHQNLRDERAEAFTSLLWDGVYEYTYVARATTPGTFVAPPAKAEEMYAPEVFGRSASATVIVEDR